VSETPLLPLEPESKLMRRMRQALGEGVICLTCGGSIRTCPARCTATPAEAPCPGFAAMRRAAFGAAPPKVMGDPL